MRYRSKVHKISTMFALMLACAAIAEPALAQSLQPITNKATTLTTNLVTIGQAGGGVAAAAAAIGAMANKLDMAWAIKIFAGGATLAGLSTVLGFVNS